MIKWQRNPVMSDSIKRTILIIEDDDGLAELIRDKLEEFGCRTAFAKSAGEAFEWLSGNTPYIMLLDYTLPDMNAKEFIAELKRENKPFPSFIISTGQGDERIAVDMMKLGARDYIIKDSNFLDMLPEIIHRVEKEIENERKVEEQKVRLENVIDGTRLGTWEWNVQTDETILNERSAEIIGYTLDELMPVSSKTWLEHAHPDDHKESEELLKKHFRGESEYFEFENRMKHKNGQWVWILNRGKVIEWDSALKPVRMFGIYMDITEKKEMYQKIQDLSIRDPLTGIFNRRYIFERLEVIVSEFHRESKNFTVSIIDIDYFKNVNDNYGHQAGDTILREFSEILSSSLRPYDLLGRYGGEEFIIVSMNVGKNLTKSRIDRILDVIRDRIFIYNENEIKITFSCGISESYELDIVSVSTLIEAADERLYEAKKSGRNKVVISS
jgi:diguanylate cyclase (GGDEF)-like protein/PAS domain S-box-containing protein